MNSLSSNMFNSYDPFINKQFEHNLKLHRKRIQTMKAITKIDPPIKYSHLFNPQKKLQQKKARYSQIEKENKQLLQRLTDITQKPGNIITPTKEYCKPVSLNAKTRYLEMERIANSNQKLIERIKYRHQSYKKKDWKKAWEDHEKHLARISRFPYLLGPDGKKERNRLSCLIRLPPMDFSPGKALSPTKKALSPTKNSPLSEKNTKASPHSQPKKTSFKTTPKPRSHNQPIKEIKEDDSNTQSLTKSRIFLINNKSLERNGRLLKIFAFQDLKTQVYTFEATDEKTQEKDSIEVSDDNMQQVLSLDPTLFRIDQENRMADFLLSRINCSNSDQSFSISFDTDIQNKSFFITEESSI